MKRPTAAAAGLWVIGYVLAANLRYFPYGWIVLFCCVLAGTVQHIFRLPGKKAVISLILACGAFVYFQWADHRNQTAALPEQKTVHDMDGTEASLEGVADAPADVDGDRASFVLNVRTWEWDGYPAYGLHERVQVTVRLLKQEEQETAARWQRGDRVKLRGTVSLPSEARNFGGFDYRSYLRMQHIHWQVSVKGTDTVSAASPSSFGWNLLRWNDRLRSALGHRLEGLFPGEEAGYMKGLLIGLRDDLDPEQFRRFSRLGLTHILAISGLQVAVFTGIVLWILRKAGLTRETNLTVTMLLLPFFILLTGSSPSVVRAGLMAMAALYASRKQILGDGIQLLSGAGLAMLIWNPYFLTDVSFQLSFLVTLGLMMWASKINGLLPLRNRSLRGAIAVTLTATLVSFPLTVYYFNQFSPMSLPANLLLVPFISFVVTPFGSAALAADFVLPIAGEWLSSVTSWANRFSFWVIGLMSGINGLQLIWPSPSLWWIAGYYVLFGAGIHALWQRSLLQQDQKDGIRLEVNMEQREKSWAYASAAALLALLLLLGYGFSPYRWTQRGEGTVAVLDVGQGDSIWIRTPEGRHMLVDGGGTVSFRKPGEEWKERRDPYEVGRKVVVPLLKQRGVHRLDYVVVSHEDADHIGGLQAVIEEIPVGRVLFNGTIKSGEAAEKFFRAALERKIPLVPVRQGMDLQIDGATAIHILSPAPDSAGSLITAEKQNEETVVFVMDMFRSRFLLTGDIDMDTEKKIIGGLAEGSDAANTTANNNRRPVDVLKVAHHGSKTSTSVEWLDYWKPKVSVISVGERNVYGHPNPDVIERLEQAGSFVRRTDREGEVQFSVTRDGLKLRTKLANEERTH